MVIFAGEWEYSKVNTGKGRLYTLKNSCFEESQNFFWMQYPNTNNQDNLNETIINGILKTGSIEIEEKGENLITNNEQVKKDEAQHKSVLENKPQTNTNTQNQSSQNSNQSTGNAFGNFMNLARQMREDKKSKIK